MNSMPGTPPGLSEDQGLNQKSPAGKPLVVHPRPTDLPAATHPTRQQPQFTQVFLTTLWPHGRNVGWVQGARSRGPPREAEGSVQPGEGAVGRRGILKGCWRASGLGHTCTSCPDPDPGPFLP